MYDSFDASYNPYLPMLWPLDNQTHRCPSEGTLENTVYKTKMRPSNPTSKKL